MSFRCQTLTGRHRIRFCFWQRCCSLQPVLQPLQRRVHPELSVHVPEGPSVRWNRLLVLVSVWTYCARQAGGYGFSRESRRSRRSPQRGTDHQLLQHPLEQERFIERDIDVLPLATTKRLPATADATGSRPVESIGRLELPHRAST